MQQWGMNSDNGIFNYHVSASPHLVVFGGIHGDEPSGTMALQRLIQELDQKQINLQRGQLTLVPQCNPRAATLNQRFAEVNLNRVFYPHEQPQKYEEHLANILTVLVKKCDYLLDLHSFTAGGTPFVIHDFPSAEADAFTAALGLPHIFIGWPEMYAKVGQNVVGDTTAYAHACGKIGVTVEAGQHRAVQAPQVAYQCVRRALIHLGMIEPSDVDVPTAPSRWFSMQEVVFFNGGKMVQPWPHLHSFQKGEVIAHDADGQAIVAPYDGLIIMPVHNQKMGEEWFYFGTELVR